MKTHLSGYGMVPDDIAIITRILVIESSLHHTLINAGILGVVAEDVPPLVKDPIFPLEVIDQGKQLGFGQM